VEVDGRAVELVRESWLVEDRWWTTRPLRRRYWEVVSTSGRNMVVFHDLSTGARRARRAHSPQGWVPTDPERVGARWVSPEDRAPEGSLGHRAGGGWFVQGP
jgi:hypothetical protein